MDKILEDQARLIARKRIELVNHSMQLEQQGLMPTQLQQQEDSLVQELLQGKIKKLWNDALTKEFKNAHKTYPQEEQWLLDQRNEAIVHELKTALKQKADKSLYLRAYL